MIGLRRKGDPAVLVGEVPAGAQAFVDKEWIRGDSDAVPAFFVDGRGASWWSDGRPTSDDGVHWERPGPSGVVNPTVVAATAFRAVALDAVAAVGEVAASSVEVVGDGVVAWTVRALLGGQPAGAFGRLPDRGLFGRLPAGARRRWSMAVLQPAAVVDTTGQVEEIVSATRRLTDLGTLVLAGPNPNPVPVNLYSDVHRRGLRLVGIGPPAAGGERKLAQGHLLGPADLEDPLPLIFDAMPVPARWYCVDGPPLSSVRAPAGA